MIHVRLCFVLSRYLSDWSCTCRVLALFLRALYYVVDVSGTPNTKLNEFLHTMALGQSQVFNSVDSPVYRVRGGVYAKIRFKNKGKLEREIVSLPPSTTSIISITQIDRKAFGVMYILFFFATCLCVPSGTYICKNHFMPTFTAYDGAFHGPPRHIMERYRASSYTVPCCGVLLSTYSMRTAGSLLC